MGAIVRPSISSEGEYTMVDLTAARDARDANIVSAATEHMPESGRYYEGILASLTGGTYTEEEDTDGDSRDA